MNFERLTVFFTTEKSLQRAWKQVFEENPPVNARSERDLVSYLKKLGDRIILDEPSEINTGHSWIYLN
jgi:hypothetical protein